jgi:hypothetical protein
VGSLHQAEPVRLPVVDIDFLGRFLPYELLLAQRRAMVWGTLAAENLPNPHIGLYLVRLEPLPDHVYPTVHDGAEAIANHMSDLLRTVLRDSDIPARVSDREHVAIVRDVDPQHAFAVAQRLLQLASDSPLISGNHLRTCVGYIIYPLSLQPNYPVDRWSTLLELARRMSRRGDAGTSASGYGLLRGPHMEEASIPESDLVPLALQNPDTLVRAGILQIQRIQLLARPGTSRSRV